MEIRRIQIETGKIKMEALLNDSETARAIAGILPLRGDVKVWGDEIYFGIPIHVDPSPDARQDLAVGELAFWPDGDAFCIFFGPTPVSTGDQPRAFSPVNVFGKIYGDPSLLKSVRNGESINIYAVK